MSGPKRLIEIDLPIKEISRHARREKSIRHGNISTLHTWWARRPLAACRGVVLAALLPDPVDDECPPSFRAKAAEALQFRFGRRPLNRPEELRKSLLDFIGEFANWDHSTDRDYVACARALVEAAYPGGPPLVVDPFAGGGAIPLEALRVGADVWASDYNPVATLLLKVILEDIPRYGEKLTDAVAEWGSRTRQRVEADLARFYPTDLDGRVPIAYLWSRVAICEGPGCGAEIPLLRELWLARGRKIALQLTANRRAKAVNFAVVQDADAVQQSTSRRAAAVCPVCNFVTPAARVRVQARAKGGLPVRMVAVVCSKPGQPGRHYRVATDRDVELAHLAEAELRRRETKHRGALPLVPNDPVPLMSGVFNAPIYGLTDWSRYFLPRQALALSAFAAAVHSIYEEVLHQDGDPHFARAVATCLGIAVDRIADRLSTLTRWHNSRQTIENTFSRQAIPMVWDFPEANPFSGATGGWDGAIEWVEKVCRHVALSRLRSGQASQCDARSLPLPDDSVSCVFTDPPYYNAVPYADLSDFFYVWLRRSIGPLYPELFSEPLVPKDGEITEMAFWDTERYAHKDKKFFETEIARALAESRRVLDPDGIAVVVFAHKTTSGWEAMLNGLLQAGWTVTGSWPLETEMSTRLRARDAAALASSVHIVCRPRPEHAGIGSWRDVRPDIERRVAEWLPRLAEEGIEGADAIFACLGPALEAYSRYERVETAAGDLVPVSTPPDDPDAPALLPTVWAAVAHTALAMLFKGAEAGEYEEDARLTALWLWTLKAAAANGQTRAAEDGEDQDIAATAARGATGGLTLDYDTARKLAQALGVHLEAIDRPGGIIEVQGSNARLRSVTERRQTLLRAETARAHSDATLFDFREVAGPGWVVPGATTLDRLHQAMLIFASGHGDALRRLIAEPGFASDEYFMRLARSLSALYPTSSQEKRWLDGVLAATRQMR